MSKPKGYWWARHAPGPVWRWWYNRYLDRRPEEEREERLRAKVTKIRTARRIQPRSVAEELARGRETQAVLTKAKRVLADYNTLRRRERDDAFANGILGDWQQGPDGVTVLHAYDEDCTCTPCLREFIARSRQRWDEIEAGIPVKRETR